MLSRGKGRGEVDYLAADPRAKNDFPGRLDDAHRHDGRAEGPPPRQGDIDEDSPFLRCTFAPGNRLGKENNRGNGSSGKQDKAAEQS